MRPSMWVQVTAYIRRCCCCRCSLHATPWQPAYASGRPHLAGSSHSQQLMLPLMPVQLETWFSAAGLRTWKDGVGNVHGRADGAHPGEPAVLLGSHYDTVRDAGKFDGALGIIVGLAALEGLLVQVSCRTPWDERRTSGMPSMRGAAHLVCGRQGTLCGVRLRQTGQCSVLLAGALQQCFVLS